MNEDENKEPSLRDSIDAAFETVDPPEENVVEAKPAVEGSSETEGEVVEGKVGLERDEKGRIVAKETSVDVEAPPAKIEEKAPHSWSPALREKWAELPTEVKERVIAREREIATGFNEIGDVKKFRDQFLGTVNPYNHVFQAEGNEPLRTIDNLLKTAGTLYTGSSHQKAATVAAIIKNFSIDIATLDAMLSNSEVPQERSGQDINSIVQQAVNAALAPQRQREQASADQSAKEREEEVSTFANDPKNDFFTDVKDTMADLMEAAANRGQKMSLQTAYSRAILAHNDIAQIVAERQLRSKSVEATAAAKAAKAKASRIRGNPSRESNPSGDSLRDALDAAIEAHS